MRTIVFGDIHNSYLALVEVIEQIKPAKEDKLIFLGDYVDRWDDTERTLNYLMELGRKFNCIFLMGNHDSSWGMFSYFDGMGINPDWIKYGGNVTKNTFDEILEDNPEWLDLVEEFFSLPNLKHYYLDEQNRLFVHGGYSTKQGIETAHHDDFMWDRSLVTSSLISSVLAVEKPLRLELYKEIYVGHTPTLNLEKTLDVNNIAIPEWDFTKPLLLHNLIAMDTGAGHNGRLSAMDIDTKEVWQSSLVKDLYK